VAALSLALLALVLSGGAAVLHFFAARDLQDLAAGATRLVEWRRERQRIEAQIEQLRSVQKTAENTVEACNTTVRTAHRLIAAIPFGILEAIPATRHTTRLVRTIHDQISDVVYDSISGTNRILGKALRQGLESGASTDAKTSGPAALPDANRKPEGDDS
jgi:hypothetical protein